MKIQEIHESALDPLERVRAADASAGLLDLRVTLNPLYLGAIEAGSLVGVASLSTYDDSGELYKLYVAPRHRRTGVGFALFEAAVQELRARGIKELHVQALTEAGRRFLVTACAGREVQQYDTDKCGIRI